MGHLRRNWASEGNRPLTTAGEAAKWLTQRLLYLIGEYRLAHPRDLPHVHLSLAVQDEVERGAPAGLGPRRCCFPAALAPAAGGRTWDYRTGVEGRQARSLATTRWISATASSPVAAASRSWSKNVT